MSGETDLDKLLASMSPQLGAGEFVFCSFADAQYGDYGALRPVAVVVEPEGLTLVITREVADAAGIPYESVFRQITLQVHSSLDAVGLTAAFSVRLAEHDISANVIAGYYHDHIFVQCDQVETAVRVLEALACGVESASPDQLI